MKGKMKRESEQGKGDNWIYLFKTNNRNRENEIGTYSNIPTLVIDMGALQKLEKIIRKCILQKIEKRV